MDRFNPEEVVQRTFVLKKDIFEKFKIKSQQEGYSVSEAINCLIDNYVSGIHDKRI